MAPSIITTIALLFVFLLAPKNFCFGKENVTIDAGMQLTNGSFLYLVSGNEVMRLYNKREHSVNTLNNTFRLDQDGGVEAMWSPFKPMKAIFYGRQSGSFLGCKPRTAPKKFKYGKQRSFLKKHHGADAAARKGNKVYIFKGCNMVVRHKWHKWGKPQNVTKLGLPCDIHAAWKCGKHSMVILKYDQIWIWKKNNSVVGPRPFSSKYTIHSWSLNSEPEEQQ